MATAIGAVLAFAVGVGISPIPVIAVILVLFSERRRVNGPAFLAGWLAGLSAVVAALYLLATALGIGTDPATESGESWLKVGLGVLLLGAAAHKWRGRPRGDDVPSPPKWMAGVARFTPVKAAALGGALSANPKNLVLALGAAGSLAETTPTTVEATVALAVFVLVGSALVISAVGYDLVGGARARSTLDEVKGWMSLHNTAVMAVLYLVFGAVLISQGLGLRG